MNRPGYNLSYNSLISERKLRLNKNRKKVKNYISWCAFNIFIFSILGYDIYHTKIYNLGYFHHIEYALTTILLINIFYYLSKICTTPTKLEPILITKEQKQLLGCVDEDVHFEVVDSLKSPEQLPSGGGSPESPLHASSRNTSLSTTPMNMTAFSWRSTNSSQADSMNCSVLSPSWIYYPGSSSSHDNASGQLWVPQDLPDGQPIVDEDSLNEYLKARETVERAGTVSSAPQPASNLLSSFWSHPVTKTAKDMSLFLRKCQYQLSSHVAASSGSGSPLNKTEDKSSPVTSPVQAAAMEVWAKINVDTVMLTQWNENLRKWLSQTILERLVSEMDRINKTLEKKCMTDLCIGTVGLERLRKAAHLAPVAQLVPSLASLVPFLEVHPNQEYLAARLRQLASGGCISQFRWNSGAAYNGKEWDDSLPSDAVLIMHVVASYLDTQLMPVPSTPDTKPFSGHYYLRCGEKPPSPLPSTALYIQQCSEKPPHYRVIVGERTYDMVKGYNNLFHALLFFLYNVNQMECGMLGRVNLGRAGLNMLWIIDQE